MARSRANAKDPPYEEIVLPAKLRRYSADLSAIGACFKPDQLMANCISLELAIGKGKAPIYTPYIAADVSAPPLACACCRSLDGYREVAEQQTGQES